MGHSSLFSSFYSLPSRSRGFTLIELLVVIAIIGLLASAVLAALSTARTKSRDTRRLADLNEIAKATELYASDNGSYPGAYTSFYWVSDNNYTQSLPCSGITTGLKPYFSTDICTFKDPQGYAYALTLRADGSVKLGAHFEGSGYQTTGFTWGSSNTAVSGWYERP